MEQLATAAGTASRAKEPLVTDIGRVQLPVRYTGSYRGRMIRSCGDKAAQQLLDRKFSRKFQAIEKVARFRLSVLVFATSLRDLNLAGLHPEAL